MKILAAVLTALIFNFMFLVGLKIGYIDFYDIGIYFNSFFTAKQPYIYLAFFIPTLIAFYLPKKLLLSTLIILTVICLSSFVFAKQIGKELYGQTASYQIGSHFVKDITLLFSHRGIDYVYFKDKKSTKEFKSSQRVR